MNKPPWSTNQLKKLGKCIQLGIAPPSTVPAYADVMLHYNDAAAAAQEEIRALDWEPLLGNRTFEITSRPKTIDTLRQKLQRDSSTPLPSIQDIAGVRFEAEMTLDEQDGVVNAIAGVFNHDLERSVHDLRKNPHSGYRAVHIWLRLPTRVEVQVRTHLQGEWANMYESLADVLGREIRYGGYPQIPQARKAVESLQQLSITAITELERLRNDLPKKDPEIAAQRTRLDGMAAGHRAAREREFREAWQSHMDFRQMMDALEKDIRAAMRDTKQTFDTMRINGRK